MMNAARVWPVLAFLILSPGGARSFELRTHALLTDKAVMRSVLSRDASILRNLGFDRSSDSLIGITYFDGVVAAPQPRTSRSFEVDRMPRKVDEKSIAAWLMGGAIREDDVALAGCITIKYEARDVSEECNPRDDPYGDIERPLNHFYDPIADKGLNRFPFYGNRATDWANGRIDVVGGSGRVDAARRNHFTIIDARQAMYYALSGRVLPNQVPGEATRNAWWATAFRALGSAMHLVQDMGQPQHTRNEPHSGSVFEAYMEARASGKKGYKSDGSGTVVSAPLAFPDHGIPAFGRYADLWSTAKGDGSLTGQGLANYSNRGFFTEERIFGSRRAADYPRPTSVLSDYEVVAGPGDSAPGTTVRHLKGAVIDTQAGREDRIRMAAESVFSANFGNRVFYILDRHVYDDQASLLVPRAVAYSAGLIDYFFRGRIDLVKDASRPNGLSIRNLGPEAMSGDFELYYDRQDGLRKPVKRLDGGDVSWNTASLSGAALGSGQDMPVTYDFAIPADARAPGEYVLVFRGDMGEEKASGSEGYVGAVAAKVVKAPRPSSLYIAGLDASNRVLTLKVDSRGMRQLNGYDAAGVLKFTDYRFPTGQFQDLDPVYVSVVNQWYYGRPSIPRLAHIRQATVIDGIVPSYETQGVSVFAGSYVRPLVYTRDTAGKLVWRDSVEAAWKTRSAEDNAEFDITITDVNTAGTDGKLRYVRRVTNADGSTSTDSAVIPLPSIPSWFTGYWGFREGKLFISPDGTRVSGFYSSTDGNTVGILFHGELRIAPGKTLSVTFVPGEGIPQVVRLSGGNTGDQCSSSSGGTPPDSTFTASCSSVMSGKVTNRFFDEIVDWIGGELRTWRKEGNFEYEITKNRVSTGSTTVTPKDACPYEVRSESHATDTRTDYTLEEKRFVMADGTLKHNYESRPAGVAHPACTNCTIDTTGLHVYRYTASNGGTRPADCDSVQTVADSAIVTYTSNNPGVLSHTGQEVVRTFTGKLDGSIVVDLTSDGMYSVPRFRGSALLPTAPWTELVGDASPIGELFIASPDKSFIHYEPVKDSGMPQSITIPPHVTRIIAAIWL